MEPRIAGLDRQDLELVAPDPSKAVICRYNIHQRLTGSTALNPRTTLQLAGLLDRLNWLPRSPSDDSPGDLAGGGASYNGDTQIIIFHYRGNKRSLAVLIGFGFAESQFTASDLTGELGIRISNLTGDL